MVKRTRIAAKSHLTCLMSSSRSQWSSKMKTRRPPVRSARSGVMVKRTRKTQRNERFQMSAHVEAMARRSQVRLQTSEHSLGDPNNKLIDVVHFRLCAAHFLGGGSISPPGRSMELMHSRFSDRMRTRAFAPCFGQT